MNRSAGHSIKSVSQPISPTNTSINYSEYLTLSLITKHINNRQSVREGERTGGEWVCVGGG